MYKNLKPCRVFFLFLPVVPYKLYVVALVAFLDAVHTDGVPVRRVAGVTSGQRQTISSNYVEMKKKI